MTDASRSLTCVSLFATALLGTFVDVLNRWFEFSVVRSDFVHAQFQKAGSVTQVPLHEYLLVHQQLPRTAGDSMRTHTFFDVGCDFAPARYHQWPVLCMSVSVSVCVCLCDWSLVRVLAASIVGVVIG